MLNTLIDIIPQLSIIPELLSPEVNKTYEEVMSKAAAEENKK
jgi:hypothetical protein